MSYGDYIKIHRQQPSLNTFLDRIEHYNEKNSSTYMFNTDSLNEGQKIQFTQHLNQPISVTKDAQPINDKFPLVIYHPGLGGTLNDNTVLCEFLASHGFVVVSGAFHSNNYETVSLNWDIERSTKDISFMLNVIKELPYINFAKIAAVGHSFGAQAVLTYQTEDFSPLSCLISLDNTFDYSIDPDPEGFEPLTEKLYKKIENMNIPTLVFAGPSASFIILDSLTHSNRTYAIIELSHNDYTSLASFAALCGLQSRLDKQIVWEKYAAINSHCLQFLTAHLLDNPKANEQFLSKSNYISEVHDVPKGEALSRSIPEYSDFSFPPNKQEIKLLFKNKAMDKIDKMLLIYPDIVDEKYLHHEGNLALNKDLDFAIYLFKKNVELYPTSSAANKSLQEAIRIKREKE